MYYWREKHLLPINILLKFLYIAYLKFPQTHPLSSPIIMLYAYSSWQSKQYNIPLFHLAKIAR